MHIFQWNFLYEVFFNQNSLLAISPPLPVELDMIRIDHLLGSGQPRDQVHLAGPVRGLLPGRQEAWRRLHRTRLQKGRQRFRLPERRRCEHRPAEIYKGWSGYS